MKNLITPTVATGRHLPFFASRSVLFLSVFFLLLNTSVSFGQNKRTKAPAAREYIALRIYHAASTDQLQTIEQYLQGSLLPALERSGFKKTGVFKAIDNDTATNKRIYVMVPFSSIAQLERWTSLADNSINDTVNARAYTKAGHKSPSYTRMETILLRAFAGMPQVKASGVKGEFADRVYELRSYESATEAQHLNKVQMFNEGEVDLFERLGFNAVFYGQVIAGGRMPNLMYITSFENKAVRDEHWKTFGSDPEWKTMSSLPQYQNNVSKIDITFLRPTTYSKL